MIILTNRIPTVPMDDDHLLQPWFVVTSSHQKCGCNTVLCERTVCRLHCTVYQHALHISVGSRITRE